MKVTPTLCMLNYFHKSIYKNMTFDHDRLTSVKVKITISAALYFIIFFQNSVAEKTVSIF